MVTAWYFGRRFDIMRLKVCIPQFMYSSAHTDVSFLRSLLQEENWTRASRFVLSLCAGGFIKARTEVYQP